VSVERSIETHDKIKTVTNRETFIPATFFGHADAFSPIMHLSKFTAAVWYKGFICGKICLTMFAFKELKLLRLMNGTLYSK